MNQRAVVTPPDLELRPLAWHDLRAADFSVFDADGDAVRRFRFTDGIGGGYFSLAGAGPVADGATFDIDADALARVWYRAGAGSGPETWSVAVYDGGEWSDAAQATVSIANSAPVTVAADLTLKPGSWHRFTRADVGATDADGDLVTHYRFTDGAGGGHFSRAGSGPVTDGASFVVAADALDRVWYRAGEDDGAESWSVAAYDGYAWGAATTASVTVTNAAPVTLAAGFTLKPGQWHRFVAADVQATDDDGDAITQFRFTDGVGGGYFSVAGSGRIADGGSFDIAADALDRVWYRGGNGGGSESWSVAAYDGYAWGDATDATVTVVNAAPVVTADGFVLRPGQWHQLGSANVAASDADGDTVTHYRFSDGAGGGHFAVAGSGAVADGAGFTVAAGALGRVWYRGGSEGGEASWSVAAYDGYDWGDAAAATVTIANATPEVAAAGFTIKPGQWYQFDAADLVATDADGDPVTRYRFTDAEGGGHFSVAGSGPVADGANFEVASDDLWRVWYRGGDSSGAESWSVAAFDGYEWGEATSATVTLVNAAPITWFWQTFATPDSWTRFRSWQVEGVDDDGDAVQRFRFSDAPDGGHFSIAGRGPVADGGTFEVAASALDTVWYRSGPEGNPGQYRISAHDGYEWGPLTVVSFVDHTLVDGEIDLHLDGDAGVAGTGNADDNWIVGNDGNNVLHGADGNDVLVGGDGHDYLDGEDGTGDALFGGVGNDILLYRHGGTVAVDGGVGYDTVLLGDAGAVIRFAADAVQADGFVAGYGQLGVVDEGINVDNIVISQAAGASSVFLAFDVSAESGDPVPADDAAMADDADADSDPAETLIEAAFAGVEVIDLGGGGANLLVLTRPQIEQLPQDALALRIQGDAGDVVDAPGDWIWWDSHVELGGGVSHVYRDGDAYLEIAPGVTLIDAPPPATGTQILPGVFGDGGQQINLADGGAGIIRINGTGAGAWLGFTASGGGDIDGDGYDDMLLGAPYAPTSHAYTVFGAQLVDGAVYTIDALDAAGAHRFSALTPANLAAGGLAIVGDVDGDGWHEAVVSETSVPWFDLAALIDDDGNIVAGAEDLLALPIHERVHLIRGSDDSDTLPADGDAIGAGNGTTFSWEIPYLSLDGAGVAAIGDVNGDGLADLALSSMIYAPDGQSPYLDHRTMVVLGRAGGFGAEGGDPATHGYVLDGPGMSTFASAGATLAAAGDVNGDGFDDFLVGHPHDGYHQTPGAGAAYLVYGEPDPGDRILYPHGNWPGIVALRGHRDLDAAGAALAGIGDFDGDGYDDIAVAAPLADPYGSDSNLTGQVHVLWGGPGIPTDTTLDDTPQGDSRFVLAGGAAGDLFGSAVSAAGDFNGDGYDDFVVSAPGTHGGGASDATGSVYLVFGGALRPQSTVAIDALGYNEAIEIRGELPLPESGYSVSAAGDINGDGYDDLLLGGGVTAADGTPADAGQVHIVLGRPHTAPGSDVVLVDAEGTPGADVIVGDETDQILIAGAGDDLLDGAGGNDVLIAGAGDDTVVYDAADTRRVDGGRGDDTLRVTGGTNLDLVTLNAAPGNPPLAGFERIDLAGGAPNALRVDERAVLSLSDTSNMLTVTGDAGDFVIFDDRALDAPIMVAVDGVDYVEYSLGNAVLRVQQGLLAGLPELAPTNDAGPGFVVPEDAVGIYVSPNVLANDSTVPDPALLGLEIISHASLVHTDNLRGRFGVAADGTYSYEPYVHSRVEALQEGESVQDGLTYQVTDAYGRSSSATITFEFVGANDAPELFARDLRVTAFGNVTGMRPVLDDVDSDKLRAASVRISGEFDAAVDWFRIPGADFGGITFEYASELGVVELSGLASVTDYVNALSSLRYANYSLDPDVADRTYEISVTDEQGLTTTASGALRVDSLPGNDALASLLPIGGGDGSAGYALEVEDHWLVTGGGDLNGDGLADMVVRNPDGVPASYRGTVGVLSGSLAGTRAEVQLDADAAYITEGVASVAVQPVRFSIAGDINNDGYADLVVGSESDGAVAGSAGAYLVYGAADWADMVTLADLHPGGGGDGARGIALQTPRSGIYPSNVAGIGDVNGDGFGDLAINHRGDPELDTGRLYVYFGAATGDVAEFDLATLEAGENAATGFVIEHTDGYYAPGLLTMGAAGDVNGDGVDDFFVGSAANGVSHPGSVFVVYGAGDIAAQISDLVDLSADGSEGFRAFETARSDNFGWEASTAGDFNGDGFADVLVMTTSESGVDTNRAFLLYGGSGLPAEIDLDGLAPEAGGDGSGGFVLRAAGSSGPQHPWVEGLGDVNGDGYDDIAIGTARSLAKTVIVFGNSRGDAHVDLDDLDAADGITFDSYSERLDLGGVLSALGDVNGDGYDDLYIGPPNFYPNLEHNHGFVVFGRDFSGTVDVEGTPAADVLTGTAADESIIAGSGADLVDGGAGNDVVRAGAGDDIVIYDPTDTLKVDGGSGIDTLRFDGAGVVLDFDNLHAIGNFERIDLAGGGDNSVSFDVRDILALPGVAAAFTADATRQVLISGDAGDSVVSQGQGWLQQADVEIDGVSYNAFGHADIAAQIFVDPALTQIIS